MCDLRPTEQPSPHRHLETLSTAELLRRMNGEDHTVPEAVAGAMPQIEALVDATTDHLLAGGRLFYIGAGTSGRLGVVDASECPPTFGVPHGLVVGLIAGGDGAIRKAVEFAEDDPDGAWTDLQAHRISKADMVVGIAASGTTPYVVKGLERCRAEGIGTGCITCHPSGPIVSACAYPVAVDTGAEFVTGSTRLKAGTAQKLVLNMLSTCVMIKLGRVQDNRMVDMQLSNQKLVERGTRMVVEGSGLDAESAKALLLEHGSVRQALEAARGDASGSTEGIAEG